MSRQIDYQTPLRILIVDDKAHLPIGHFPVMFAELARALQDCGTDVEVLTAHGWHLDNCQRPFPVHHAGRAFAIVEFVQRWLLHIRPRRVTKPLGTTLRDVVLTLTIRRIQRRLNIDCVIITSHRSNPLLQAALGGNGRTLIYQFVAPATQMRWHQQLLHRYAHRREQSRRARGGLTRVALNNEANRESWLEFAPWLQPVCVMFTAARPRVARTSVVPTTSEKQSRRIALLFGTPHALKDYETVWSAFAQLGEWHLVVAGKGVEAPYRRWREGAGTTSGRFTIIDEFVSEAKREQLHAAASLIVLSFQPNSKSDSGTLMDAISWGLPVVCSSPSFAGDAVGRLRIGQTYPSGSVEGLVDAVRRVPASLPGDVVRIAQEECSNRTMAYQHLSALRDQ